MNTEKKHKSTPGTYFRAPTNATQTDRKEARKGGREGEEDKAAHLCSIGGPDERGNSLVHVGGDILLRRH